ncbi:MAG: LuxR family DNA-binding response regulator [Bacteroidetes bacterium]|nr:LuxR family DNA-binding response regulator [Bacteroidota bacterium]
MTKKIKVGFVDDDVLFTEALALLLAKEISFEIFFRVFDGQGLEQAIQAKGLPDILLADLKLKAESGLDLMESLHQRYPDLRMIALSSFYKPVYVAAALRNGFAAFMPKNCSSAELTAAIFKVHEAGIYYRQEDLALIQDFLRDPQPAQPDFTSHSPLSAREIEIIRLICKQYTNTEIAGKLFLSIRTVEGHRNRILEKTGIRNSAGLVVFAITAALVDVSELSLRDDLTRK